MSNCNCPKCRTPFVTKGAANVEWSNGVNSREIYRNGLPFLTLDRHANCAPMSADIMGRVIVDLLREHAADAARRFERYANDERSYHETQMDMSAEGTLKDGTFVHVFPEDVR